MIWSSLYHTIGKHKRLFAISLFVLVLHLVTLPISPMPWFDEVFFASITKEFLRTGSFVLGMAPYIKQEILIYGPVYFTLTGLSVKLFGFSTFSFRLINFLAATGSVFLFLKLLKSQLSIPTIIIWILGLVLLIDPISHSSMHSGRMDFVALFFALLGLWFLVQKPNINYTSPIPNYKVLLSGLFSAIALLTTPRVIVLIFPLGLLLLLRAFKKKDLSNFLSLIAWGFVILMMYGIWILVAFGGIGELMEYYSQFTRFVARGHQIPNLALPLIILGAMALLKILFTQSPKVYFSNELFFVSITSILLFHSLVSLTSSHYLGMIMPYYVFLIAYAISTAESVKLNRLSLITLQTLLLGYFAFFFFKTSMLWADYSSRDPRKLDEFFAKHLPKGNNVIGNYTYFYGIEKRNCHFITYEYTELTSMDEVITFCNQEPEINYLMISQETLDTRPVKKLLNSGKWLEIANLEIPKKENSILTKFKRGISTTFNGRLYSKIDRTLQK